MFLAALVLVPIDREHDGLKKRVYLGHRDKSAQVGDVSRLRLKEEQEVAVFLGSLVVREHALLEVGGIFKMARNLVLLVSQVLVTKN